MAIQTAREYYRSRERSGFIQGEDNLKTYLAEIGKLPLLALPGRENIGEQFVHGDARNPKKQDRNSSFTIFGSW